MHKRSDSNCINFQYIYITISDNTVLILVLIFWYQTWSTNFHIYKTLTHRFTNKKVENYTGKGSSYKENRLVLFKLCLPLQSTFPSKIPKAVFHNSECVLITDWTSVHHYLRFFPTVIIQYKKNSIKPDKQTSNKIITKTHRNYLMSNTVSSMPIFSVLPRLCRIVTKQVYPGFFKV